MFFVDKMRIHAKSGIFFSVNEIASAEFREYVKDFHSCIEEI